MKVFMEQTYLEQSLLQTPEYLKLHPLSWGKEASYWFAECLFETVQLQLLSSLYLQCLVHVFAAAVLPMW